MPAISLFNAQGRDAQVAMETVRVAVRVRYLDSDGRQAQNVRLLKGTIDRDYDALLAAAGSPEAVGQQLIDGDPEVDLETVGTVLRDTSRVYVNADRQVVYHVAQMEIVRNPDDTEKLRRPKADAQPNVVPEQPLVWGGKLVPKAEAARKFVFSNKLQLKHVNGLTYDFLYGIAKDLEAKNGLLVMGAGPKANQPLILRRGSLPYRGFLEGRTRGADYCLILHLSNQELKAATVEA